ncbi:MAG: glycosyltransferase family 2 protein [Bacteroidetes bacterium]|nr:glycosyltransferase family 2 protein [Bacteroidota bacterium]
MISISVIIPCYNVEKYIEEGLLSVLNQTHPAKEIICIDDSSTDDTIKIIRNLQEKFPNKIFLYLNEKNRGATYTRNRGLAIAKGDFIQFFDADDILLPEKFEHQIKIISECNYTPDIIVNDFQRKNLDGSFETISFPAEDAWCGLLEGRLGVTTSNLYRRENVIAVRGWTEELLSSQEYDLMFRMLVAGSLVLYDTKIISYNRERLSGSITKSDPAGKWIRFINLRERIYNYLLTNSMLNQERLESFKKIMFDSIRILYKYNKKEAINLHHKYIQLIKINEPTLSTSKKYLSVYNIFGFRIAEFASRIVNPPNDTIH